MLPIHVYTELFFFFENVCQNKCTNQICKLLFYVFGNAYGSILAGNGIGAHSNSA